MRILVKNEIGNNPTMTLFPKAKYMDGHFYKFSDLGTGYRNTTFEITPLSEQELFISGNIYFTAY